MKFRFISNDGTEYVVLVNNGQMEMVQGTRSIERKPNDPFIFTDHLKSNCFMVVPPIPAMPPVVYEMAWYQREVTVY